MVFKIRRQAFEAGDVHQQLMMFEQLMKIIT